jgi:uncharacterized protein (UPF0332 family)
MSRARETYEDASRLLQMGSANSATNRLYYAAFYAARALLATKGLDASKHSGVISLFNKHFVKAGVIQPEVAKILKASFEKRQDVDYEDFAQISSREAGALRAKVLTFIQGCESTLDLLVKQTAE